MNKIKTMPMMIIMAVIILGGTWFAWQGFSMHREVSVQEAAFHALQAEYFNLSKVEREAAATGSALNQQLVEIQNFPSELLRLKLVGIGNILSGIFLLLLGILLALIMMPVRLKQAIRQG